MPGGKQQDFGLFRTGRKNLTPQERSFRIVGVTEHENMIQYGTYSSLEEAKKRIAEIKDTEITISIFTEANRTVYREER